MTTGEIQLDPNIPHSLAILAILAHHSAHVCEDNFQEDYRDRLQMD